MALYETLPNNYEINNKEYAYKIPDSTPVSFFLNTENPIPTSVIFSNLRLSVFDGEGNEVISDVWQLLKVDLTGGYRIYVQDMMVSGLINGYKYYFVIYNTVDSKALFILNCFEFVHDASVYVRLEYRNSTNVYNYNYEELPTYKNVFFVDLNQIDSPPEYDLQNYTEVSTGYVRNEKSQLKYGILLEGHNFDERAGDAMKGLAQHDEITLNFRKYQLAQGWEREANRRTKRANGTITVYDQEKNEVNLNG